MNITNNATLTKVGQAYAVVIADSEWNGDRITTLELVYPRYIHSELLTHRVFSRNSASSRATPIDILAAEAREPVFFDYVGVDKPGMQAGDAIPVLNVKNFHNDWVALANYVADWVEKSSARYNIHKQTLNRVLEPFTRIKTLVTSTEWNNFFKLRLAEDTQPEMCSLARAMKQAMDKSAPEKTQVHTPYSPDGDLIRSVACCARVSYARLDGKPDSRDADVRLFNKLLTNGHMSPFEHAAYWVPDHKHCANFVGWQSHRYKLEHAIA